MRFIIWFDHHFDLVQNPQFSLSDSFFGKRRRRRRRRSPGESKPRKTRSPEEEGSGLSEDFDSLAGKDGGLGDWAEGDDWDEDWNNEEEETRAIDPECEGVEPPDFSSLSISDFTELARIKLMMDEEGFSLNLAKEVSRTFYPEPYCNFVKSSPTACFEQSLLELFAEGGELDRSMFDNLTFDLDSMMN